MADGSTGLGRERKGQTVMDKYDVPIKIITQKELVESGCFDVQECIRICEEAFREYALGKIILPDKISVVFDQETQDRINCLPAALMGKSIYGMKWVSVFPGNPNKKNLSNVTAVILLSELENGYPVALLEGSMCTCLRTAAVGAIAARYFAKQVCGTIGLIGAGEQAKSHFLFMKAVRPEITVCRVSSRTHESEQEFVRQMSRFYPDVEFIPCSGNHEKAAVGSDIIITAISGQEKILRAEWIGQGVYYCHVAGLEDEFAVAKKADKIVCDNWNTVKHRTQTISRMYQLGMLADNDIYANLDEVITGKKAGRENDQEFVYFNSVGMSFLDVGLANWMYGKAVKEGKGQTVMMKTESLFDMDIAGEDGRCRIRY